MLGIWTLGRNIFVYPLWSSHQCDQIGRFLKILGLKICYKSSPKDCQLFGLFCKTSLLCKNCLGYFLGILGNIRATFYSNIWSHCFPSISISNWSWQSIICLSTFFSKNTFLGSSCPLGTLWTIFYSSWIGTIKRFETNLHDLCSLLPMVRPSNRS